MSDRGLLFLFSILMIVAALGGAGWLAASGQTLTVDGLFLTLTLLLTAVVFLLFVVFMVRRAMEAQVKPAAAKSAAAKVAAPAGAKEQIV